MLGHPSNTCPLTALLGVAGWTVILLKLIRISDKDLGGGGDNVLTHLSCSPSAGCRHVTLGEFCIHGPHLQLRRSDLGFREVCSVSRLTGMGYGMPTMNPTSSGHRGWSFTWGRGGVEEVRAGRLETSGLYCSDCWPGVDLGLSHSVWVQVPKVERRRTLQHAWSETVRDGSPSSLGRGDVD